MGAITHHPKYGLQLIWAKATILATGTRLSVSPDCARPTEAR